MPTEENVAYQNFETVPVSETTPVVNSDSSQIKTARPKKKKLILIIILVVAFLVLLLAGLIILNQQKPSAPATDNTPTTTPTPTPDYITNPSPYATDSAVLQIEERVKKLEKELQETDLKETGLTPPIIDLNVNFK